jgi:esterase/lipase superfamily enzyme
MPENAQRLAFPGAVVFYSWPSDASLKAYFTDTQKAENSGPALARVIESLLAAAPDGPIYLVAHSMGKRVALNALIELREAKPATLSKALREVVMAAPDVDQYTFRLRFAAKIFDLGPRYTLYASKNDLALSSSQHLNGGKRLGFGGADIYESFGLDSIDASDVTKEFFSIGQSYFGDPASVLGDLFYLIRQGLPPGQRPNLKSIPGHTAWRIESE